jgi:hypothetical protein
MTYQTVPLSRRGKETALPGLPVEYFVICCDLLSSVRLQLTAVIQLVLWMLAKLDKISETPVFSRLSDLAPIIT